MGRYSELLVVRVPAEIRDGLEVVAQTNGQTSSAVIRRFIEAGLYAAGIKNEPGGKGRREREAQHV